jgi:hypothetical protein
MTADIYAVVDGATALTEQNMAGLNTSAFTAHFVANVLASSTGDAGHLLAAANTGLRKELERSWPKVWEMGKLGPSAGAAVIRIHESTRATLSSISDCAVLGRCDGVWQFLSVPDTRHAELDDEVVRAILELKRRLPQSWSVETQALLVDNRLKSNIEYGVLNGEPAADTFIHNREIDLAVFDSIVLMTDGMIWPSGGSFAGRHFKSAEMMMQLGIAGCHRQLKALYDADAELVQFPRLKHMDDCAAIILKLR